MSAFYFGRPITADEAVSFLDQAARYFDKRPTNGEDARYWANVGNAEACRAIAELVRLLSAQAPDDHKAAPAARAAPVPGDRSRANP